jgi:hypothetical protein
MKSGGQKVGGINGEGGVSGMHFHKSIIKEIGDNQCLQIREHNVSLDIYGYKKSACKEVGFTHFNNVFST